MTVIILLLITSFAARCPYPSWVVNDDRIAGFVSKEGRPVKLAAVELSSPVHEYSAITDKDGAFAIEGIPDGKYSFAVKGWGRATLEVKGWHRGGINRPFLQFSSIKGCLLLIMVSN